MNIRFTLNANPCQLDVDPVRPLLDVLREDLRLTGTKQGCDHEGECGACTVLLNDEPVRSCLTPVGKVHGQRVTTIEGLGSLDHLHPLQQAFLEVGAVQCGYCTPGMLLTAKALLDQNPYPSADDIKQELAGNICRCTGYTRIVQAVQLAAERMAKGSTAHEPAPDKEERVLGGSNVRVDGLSRVTGRALFAEDIPREDLLHLLVIRSPHHHARLLDVKIKKAQSIPGVVKVLTAADIPGENGLGDYSSREPILTPIGGTCKMQGAPVALLVAVSPEAARKGGEAVQVRYQVLPHHFTIEETLGENAARLYPDGNQLAEASVRFGDLEEAFSSAELVLETTYHTAWQEHAAIERETVLGYYQQDTLTLIGGTHEPHWQQGYAAAVLGVTPKKVRVIMPPTGGSFGGKQDPWPFAATALAVYHTGRPVRLAYSREESLLASPKRHPYRVHYQIGMASEGTLTGIQVRVDANTGGYDGHGQYIADYALTGSGGPYRYQAVDGYARSVFTNGPKGGQFRGFGSPQSSFALECTLDELAQAAGVDPLQLRLQNALTQDAVCFLGYPVGESLAYRQVLETIQPHYRGLRSEVSEFNRSQPPDSPLRKAVGFSGMWYRYGKSGDLQVPAHLELTREGEIILYCSGPDYGQGSSTALLQIAAEVLGLTTDQLDIVNADTGLTPDSGIQGASRTTYFVGGAVQKAAENLKHTLLSTAAEMLDCPPETLTLGEKIISCRRGPEVSLEEVAAELDRLDIPRTVEGTFDLSPQFPAEKRPQYLPLFVTGAQAVEVLVNTGTGTVHVPQVIAAHDVGRAINPVDARGQVEGAVLMGLGTALMEEYLPGHTRGFGDYYLPTSMELPEITTLLIEEPSFHGPMGAKGLGEAALVPTAPAIINGISRAVGARIRTLPATPERVLQAVQAGREDSSR